MPLPNLTQPKCVDDPGTWCSMIYGWTHNEWLAAYSQWLIAIPLKIAVILLVAVLFRYFVHRTISRFTRGNGDGKTPRLLRPLRERTNELTAPVLNERRRQRARTIASVLKSLCSSVCWRWEH